MRAQAAIASRCAIRSSRERATRKNLWVKLPEPVSVGQVSTSLLLGIVQRIVEPRDRARRVAERRMRGDVVDALAVDIDLASVAQAFEVFRAGERAALAGDHVLGLHPAHVRSPWPARLFPGANPYRKTGTHFSGICAVAANMPPGRARAKVSSWGSLGRSRLLEAGRARMGAELRERSARAVADEPVRAVRLDGSV